ncbi:MAG: aldehyde ferredoxin oxidoreductase C-terminal domain-containing protein, partial [Fimbriimonadaceae bacterium]|nr:aldehyde ferredoxin oxidoreductase C-terminal domain-containing protein [Alphaproteobacteria bacterium]
SKEEGRLEVGGEYIHELNSGRGGEVSHACMPGCLIKCSNIYVDAEGNEMVSPLEYETISLLGTNCALDHPDDIARMNYFANDLGIDTIEVGATIGVLMEAGEGAFGDTQFMASVFDDLRAGNERGRLYAQGTARVGEHFGVKRVPVIKKQAISAYDPRVIEVTGVSMMVTAQGADHTTGNLPTYKSEDKDVGDLARASYQAQVGSAVADSLGLCIFGRSVTDENLRLIADAINAAHDAGMEPDDLLAMGRDALRMEHEFNVQAGFTQADDELPEFFTTEPLAPTNKVSRLRSAEVNRHMQVLMN